MIARTIGILSTALVAYAIKDAFFDSGAYEFGWDDKESSKTTHKEKTKSLLEDFYALRKKVYKGSYKEFISIIEKIKNIKLEADEVKLSEKIPKHDTYKEEINQRASELYIKLGGFDEMLKSYNKKISTNLLVSDDFEVYLPEAKQIISDAMVVANTISDLLNVQVVSKKGKASKSSYRLLQESDKILYNLTREQSKSIFEKVANIDI